jgi:uncharacterized protein
MKFKILYIFLFSAFIGTAQETTLKEDAKQLVLLTFDTSEKKQIKYSLNSTLDDDKKESFKKEYDAAINAYVEECSNFYIANYTHEEIKEMLKFYQTPVGQKIAKDSRKLLEGSFPLGKEWDMQLYNLKDKKGKKD